jgi:UPF0755 protein
MRRLFLLFLVIGGFILGVWVKVEYGHFSRDPLRVGHKGLYFVIPKGATIRSVAAELHRNGVLEHPLYLVLLARWKGVARDIKAGEYCIQPATMPLEFLHQIVTGKVVQYSLTLVEGWTFSQMIAAVRNNSHLKQTLNRMPASEIMKYLGYPKEHPEGRFFPDTYFFPAGTTDLDFLHRAYRLMKEHLIQEWKSRAPKLPYQNPDEALVLASIIERESALPEERPLIAGVFTRRLQKGMRLQADPTVIYGLGKYFNRDLRHQDLKRDTPYNTYTRLGLPPTPICMPSLESLQAALHPTEGEALYFVARGDGSHHFSATLKEHRAAVQAYQLGIFNNIK